MNQAKITLFIILGIASITLKAQKNIDSILVDRAAYKQAFLDDDHSPLNKKGIRKLRFYPPDTKYIVTGDFTELTDSSIFTMPTSSGKLKEYVRYGLVSFTINGDSCTLTVYQSVALRQLSAYQDYLFIPFNDETNGTDTYGGGRYMDIRFDNIQDGQLTLDFNSCYNPYCAYSDGYSCPVPPAENKLDIPILAGEMHYAGQRTSH